jgi:fibronectin type 3 domain-containing protein
MRSPHSRYRARRVVPACAALVASIWFVGLASCGWDSSSGRVTPTSPSSASPTPRQTGISATEAAAIVPLAPVLVTAEGGTAGVRLTWSGTGQDDVHYLIHRKIAGAQEWAQLTTVAISGDNRGRYSFTDTTGEHGKTYVYGVGAVSSSGKESAITQTSPVTIPAS